MQPPKVCFHFAQRGFCGFGSSCRFVHERSVGLSTGGYQYAGGRLASTNGGRGGGRGGQYRGEQAFGRQQSYTIYHEEQVQSVWTSSERPSQTAQPRHFREWSQPANERPQDPCLDFRFMSWNILAAELAYTHAAELYPRARPAWLDWPGRLAAVVDQVAAHRPDVLCLQEVDDWPGLRSALAPLGYDGVHVQRTGGRGDGCATLWLRDRLRIASGRRPNSQSRSSASGSEPKGGSRDGRDGGSNRSSDGAKSGDGVLKVRMADHGLKDNVALLVHLAPVGKAKGSSRSRGRGGEDGGAGGGRAAESARTADGGDMEVGGGSDSDGGRSKRSRQAVHGHDGGDEDAIVIVDDDDGGDGVGGAESQLGRRQKRSRCSSDGDDSVIVIDDGDGDGGASGRGTAAEADSAGAAAATQAIAALRPYSQSGSGAAAAPATAAPAAAAADGTRPRSTTPGRQRRDAAPAAAAAAPAAAAAAAAAGAAAGASTGPRPFRLPRHLRRGFWVANTHVLFNTKRGDIKLGQLRVILTELAARAAAAEPEAEHGGDGDRPEGRTSDGADAAGAAAPQLLPCIFAGDFNSAPGSGLYRFLRHGVLELAGEDRRELSGQVEGYGYSQLQLDARQGRPPRLARWGPPPPPQQQQQQQPAAAPASSSQAGAGPSSGAREQTDTPSSSVSETEQWRRQTRQQQEQYDRGDAVRGSSYSVRWDMEELENAMGRVALAQAVATASSSSSSAGAAAQGLAGLGPRSFSAGDRSNGGGGGIVRTLTEAELLPLGGRHNSASRQQGRGGGGRGQGRGGGGGNMAGASWGAIKETAVVRHPLALRSAYAALDPAGREPLFTTLHARYVGTVDFVWYTPGGAAGGSAVGGDGEAEAGRSARREGGGSGRGAEDGFRLEPLRVLNPPDPLSYPYGMPCDGWPSDHVSMVVDFRLS